MTNARPGTLINCCAGVRFASQHASSSHAPTSICSRPQFNRIECRARCPSRSLVLRRAARATRPCASSAALSGGRVLARTCDPRLCWARPIHSKALEAPSERRICGVRVSTVNTRCSPPVAASYRLSACTAPLHCGTCVRSCPCAPHLAISDGTKHTGHLCACLYVEGRRLYLVEHSKNYRSMCHAIIL
jgi:hypothetical protein